ncbi:MAG: hypothetical protein A3C58_01550 [Candidatus Staskawiczbacteria bacterium RIFCSPHIGHO2_02_FULL_34_10]|uniref:Addiction module toxin, HicA family n=2 Tax=Candidatus Staskawicziibacteriota TaxID=1817916 RepID=A0A1G2HLX3_9BACT|nr:MAG: hypothetical protein A2639_02075 [Candidatus Staskawiczbacteria bacterium RIFCSPHIGHO2_01_FULL_34_27]OGZ66219.1 MAG: hypothetical protein A3C58_01550 [Candidatus Staskawiczbacteria bacterium RIFCSPHIGHO2_02_FULL_34_10]
MPKLYSSKHIAKVLQSKDFLYISQRGSHVKFCKYNKNTTLTVIVPANKKEIPYGTFKSILRQSKLTEEDFNM